MALGRRDSGAPGSSVTPRQLPTPRQTPRRAQQEDGAAVLDAAPVRSESGSEAGGDIPDINLSDFGVPVSSAARTVADGKISRRAYVERCSAGQVSIESACEELKLDTEDQPKLPTPRKMRILTLSELRVSTSHVVNPPMCPSPTPPVYNFRRQSSTDANPPGVSPGTSNDALTTDSVDGAEVRALPDQKALVPFDELYTMGDLLAKSGMSAVYHGTIREGNDRYGSPGQAVAVKVVNVEDDTSVALGRIKWEAKGTFRAGGHKNVVEAIETVIQHNEDHSLSAYFVLELCDSDLLITTKRAMPRPCVVNVFSQMAHGLMHIHSRNMCHRDIKLGNYLVKVPAGLSIEDIAAEDRVGQLSVKLADFGMWTHHKDSGGAILLHKSVCGSVGYSAPEQLVGDLAKEGYDGQKADVFALGVSLFVLVNQFLPWKTMDATRDRLCNLWMTGRVKTYWETIDSLLEKKSIVNPVNSDASFRDLVTSMMSVDPTQRPTVQEVLEHPFISGDRSHSDTCAWHNDMVPDELKRRIVSGMNLGVALE